MTARDGEHDLVTNFDCVCCERMWVSLCVRVFVALYDVCVVVQWQGAEGSLFQHQQADESLGPNSLEAELALLLSLSLSPLSLSHKQTHNLKFNTAMATVTNRAF